MCGPSCAACEKLLLHKVIQLNFKGDCTACMSLQNAYLLHLKTRNTDMLLEQKVARS